MSGSIGIPLEGYGLPTSAANLDYAFNELVNDLGNDLNDDVVQRITDDVDENFCHAPDKPPTGSKILVDSIYTHPLGYIKGTNIGLITTLENVLATLDSDSPLRPGLKKFLSYCKYIKLT